MEPSPTVRGLTAPLRDRQDAALDLALEALRRINQRASPWALRAYDNALRDLDEIREEARKAIADIYTLREDGR